MPTSSPRAYGRGARGSPLRSAPLLMQEIVPARHGPRLRPRAWRLPRSGDDLLRADLPSAGAGIAYRVRFHPLTTDELPRILGGLHDYARLMRLDRPIGIWLLLWPTLWALWIGSRGKPNAAHLHHFRGRHGAHALRGLRHQRLRRPQLRSARGAHQGPASGGRAHLARSKPWCCSPCCRWPR